MNNNLRISTKEFKNFIESLGLGYKLVAIASRKNKIFATCLTNSQNPVYIKMIFNEYECEEILDTNINNNKHMLTKHWQNFINSFQKNSISTL